MSDMKCPFCQRELLLSSYRDDDTAHQMWSCLSCQLSAYRKMWEALIRTRKALDVAVDALKLLNSEGKRTRILGLISITDTALDKIKTALEQKDVK